MGPMQNDEDTGTTDSSKDSTEALRGVTYRPQMQQKSTTCLGGCSDRKGSVVSNIKNWTSTKNLG